MSIFKALDYQSWVEGLQGDRAVDVGASECQMCGHCCAYRPCIPTPAELRKIAKFLKMPVKEAVKKYFVLDRLPNPNNPFLFPAKTTQQDLTGHGVPSYRTFDKGYCVFFDKETGCKIYPVLPYMAKNSYCWKDNGKSDLTTPAVSSWKDIDLSKFGITSENIAELDYDPDAHHWE